MPFDHLPERVPPDQSQERALPVDADPRLSLGTSLLVIVLCSLTGWVLFMLVAKTLWGLAGY